MNSNRWIFLRGLTRGNIHWAGFPSAFQGINPDAEMEFLEIPGNGYCFDQSSPLSVKKLIESLRSKSKFVQDKKSFNICGISLGGMAAMKWCEVYPEEIESVTVINTSLSQYSSFDKRLLPENYELLIRTLFLTNTYEQEKNVMKITSNKFNENRKYLEVFSEFSKQHEVTKINFLRQLILAKSVHIETIPLVPFKIINSTHDRLVHYSCSVEIAAKLGGDLITHPTAGHDLPLDEPEWLSEILVKNLE